MKRNSQILPTCFPAAARRIHPIWQVLYAIFFAIAICLLTSMPSLAMATETDYAIQGENSAATYPEAIEAQSTAKALLADPSANAAAPQATSMDPLAITCTYTTPRVGEPTTFTMHGSGGSGSYKYLQNYIHVFLDGRYTDDADWTYKHYTADNTFEYTFVAPGTYELRLYIMDVGSSPIETQRTTFTVVVEGTADDLTIEQAANQLAQETLDAGCATDYEKALYVHDWLIANATYDHSLEYDGESGVLLRGAGTCESFYRAYALVLNRLGIRSERAVGNGHVWNRLLLDGAWTHVDTTWDADQNPDGDQASLDHLYFGLTDEMIQEVHNEYSPVPDQKATSYTNNYYLRSGEVALWADALCENIADAIKAGTTTLDVATPQSAYPNMYAIMGRTAAYYASQKDWGEFEVDALVRLQGELNKESYYHVSIAKKDIDQKPIPPESSNPSTPSDPTEPGTIDPGDPDTPDDPTLPNGPNTPTDSNNGETSSGDTSSSGDSSSAGDQTDSSEAGSQLPPEQTSSGKNQWIKDSTGWWYRYANGTYPHSGWERIAGQWYYFDTTGYMLTGWVKDGAWYYLKPSGAMATGWQKVGGCWYYLQPGSGAMQTGWVKEGSTWYYLNKQGAMVTGWLPLQGAWYYLKASGGMTTGWYKINNTWYYFYNSGIMAANTTIGPYQLNGDGAWIA